MPEKPPYPTDLSVEENHALSMDPGTEYVILGGSYSRPVTSLSALKNKITPKGQNQTNVPEGTGIHGAITDNPLLLSVLDAGNKLRYGKSEAERQADVQGLRTPGVRDAAYGIPGSGTLPIFDPAAAERYTSAYQFGQKFRPPTWLQPLLHKISSRSRAAMAKSARLSQMFGVGPERPELERAEQLGMERGALADRVRKGGF